MINDYLLNLVINQSPHLSCLVGVSILAISV